MRAIAVYRSCLSSLFERAEDEAAAKRLVAHSLPAWAEALLAALGDQRVTELGLGFGVRLEAVRTLTLLVRGTPKAMARFLPALLKAVWDLLVVATAPFVQRVVNCADDDDEAESGGVFDDEGDAIGVEAFMDHTLELFGAMAQSGNKTVRALLEPPAVLHELVALTLSLMQVSTAQCQAWEDDPNEYVAAEDDTENAYSVRAAGKTLILLLIDAYDNAAVEAISVAAAAALAQAGGGNANAWKLREAAVLAVGLVAETLPDVSKELAKRAKRNRKKQHGSAAVAGAGGEEAVALNVVGFIENVLLPDMDPARAANALVRARALWCGCEYATHVPDALRPALVHALVFALGADQPLPVRLSAARGFGTLCCAAEEGEFDAAPLEAALPAALGSLCALLTVAQEETLHMVLDSLSAALALLNTATGGSESGAGGGSVDCAAIEAAVTPLLLRAWSQHADDCFVADCVADVFGALARIAACVPGLQRNALPPLAQLLAEPARWPSGVLTTALAILQVILRASAAGSLPNELVAALVPLIAGLALESDDHALMQEATAALAVFLERAAAQCVALEHVPLLLRAAARQLDPAQSEEGSANVGRLLTRLLAQCGDHATVAAALPDVLRAALVRLECATNPNLIRGLLLLFARFVNAGGADKALELFAQLPDICVRSADILVSLQPQQQQASAAGSSAEPPSMNLAAPLVLLIKWALNHGDLETMSPYYTKCSVHALLLLLQCPRLHAALQVPVQGHAIVDAQASRRPATRSQGRGATVRYTVIPLASKLLGLLVGSGVLAARKRGGGAFGRDGDDEDSDDDEDDEEGDEEDGGGGGGGAGAESAGGRPSPFVDADEYSARGGGVSLSDRLDFGFDDDEDGDGEGVEEDDADATDPVGALEVADAVPAALRQLLQGAGDTLAQWAQALPPAEQAHLRTLLGAGAGGAGR